MRSPAVFSIDKEIKFNIIVIIIIAPKEA